jgi:hypothetical protein
MIHLVRERAKPRQLTEMLEALDVYVKLAVDVRREILAGGGTLHADCEAVLLEDGSRQEDIWGADWFPATQQVSFEALINIRTRQGNPSMVILDSEIQGRVEVIARRLLGGVEWTLRD